MSARMVGLGGGDESGEALEGENLVASINGGTNASPHKALFWRLKNGEKGWAVRTPTAKLLQMGNKPPQFYDMVADPYESTNLAGTERPERAQLATMWNDWNSGNTASTWLPANAYPKERLAMYRRLHETLVEKAAKVEKVVVK